MHNSGLKRSKKMQHISFHSVEEFLEYLPKEELEIVERIRGLIYQAIPDICEKLSYNVPFFKRNSTICFIWPPSVPWGSKTYPFVRMGFSKGYMIEDAIGYLEKEDRQQVYCRDFTSADQIDEITMLTYLTKALIIDEQF